MIGDNPNSYLPAAYGQKGPLSAEEMATMTEDAPQDMPGILRWLNLLDYFGRPVRSLLHGDPGNALKSLVNPMGGGGVKAYSFTEDMANATGNKWLGLALGMPLDLASDPISALGVGTTLGRAAVKTGSGATRAALLGAEEMGAGASAIKPATSAAVDLAKTGGPRTTEELIQQVSKGQSGLIGFHAPFGWVKEALTGEPAQTYATNLGLDFLDKAWNQVPGTTAGRVLRSLVYGPSGLAQYGEIPNWADKAIAPFTLPFRLGRNTFSAVEGVGQGVQQGMPGIERLNGGVQRSFGQADLMRRHLQDNIRNLTDVYQKGDEALGRLNEFVGNALERGSVPEAVHNQQLLRALVEEFGNEGPYLKAAREQNPDLFKGITDRLSVMQQLLHDPNSLSPRELGVALKTQEDMQNFLLRQYKLAGVDPEELAQITVAGPNLPDVGGTAFTPAGQKGAYLGPAQQPGMANVHVAGPQGDQVLQVPAESLTGTENKILAQITGAAVDHGLALKRSEDITRKALESLGYKTKELDDLLAHGYRSWGAGRIRSVTEKVPEAIGALRSNMERMDVLRGGWMPSENLIGPMAQNGKFQGTQFVNILSKDARLVGGNYDLDKEAARMVKLGKDAPIDWTSLEPSSVLDLGQGQHGTYLGTGPDGTPLAYNMATHSIQPAGTAKALKTFDHLSPELRGDVTATINQAIARGGQRPTVESAISRLQELGAQFEPAPSALEGLDPEAAMALRAKTTQDKTKALAEYLVGQSPEAAKSLLKNGIFGKDYMTDALINTELQTRTYAGLNEALSMLAHGANADESGIPLSQFLSGDRATKQGLGLDGGRAGQAMLKRILDHSQDMLDKDGRTIWKANPNIQAALAKANDAVFQSGGRGTVLDNLYVPRDVANLAHNLIDSYVDPDRVNHAVLDALQSMGKFFKTAQYSAWTGSHLRNWLSGQWANALSAPGGDVGGYFKSYRRVGQWLENYAKGNVEPLQAGKLPDAIKALMDFGAISQSDMAHSLTGLSGEAPLSGQGLFSRIVYGLPLSGPTNRMAAEQRALAESLTGAPSTALGQAAAGAKQFAQQLQLGARDLGNTVEFMNRAPMFVHLLEKGWEPAAAANMVKAIHFDYGELSTADQWLRSLLPFWSWTRKNVPRQLRNLAESAVSGGAMAVRASGSLQRMASGASQDIPDYLKEGTFLPAGTDPSTGRAFALSMRGLFPHEDLHWFGTPGEGLSEVIPGASSRTFEKLVGMLNPAVLGVAQWATGKEFWSGKPLRDVQPFPAADPNANEFVNAFVGRPLGYLRDAMQTGQAAAQGNAEDAFRMGARLATRALVGGIREAGYYPEEERLRNQRQSLESYLYQQPEIGQGQFPFIKKAPGQPAPNPELERLVKEVGRLSQEQARLRRVRLGVPQ